MKHLLLLLAGLCAGGLLPIQGAINAQLGKSLNHPMQATFISFFGALIAICLFLAIYRPEMPTMAALKATPLLSFSGGIYGVIFVTTILMLAPRIGIANTLVATVVGQVLVSVVLDHFGLFGLPKHPATMMRLLGGTGLIVSLWLVQKT